jgi:hypothetical protein
MNVQGLSSSGIYSSEILQKQTAASNTQETAEQTQLRASQDTYVPEDASLNESAGIYSVVTDATGAQTISFDAPAQSAAAQGTDSSSGSTDSTEDIEEEIEELEEEKTQLQQELQGTSDEAQVEKLKKQISQLDTQIQMKENEKYMSESESEE